VARRSAQLALATLSVAAGALPLWGCPQLRDDEFRAEPAAVADAGSGGSGGARGGRGAGAGTGGDADAAVDPAAPRVIGSRPAPDERGVARDVSIELRFSDPMDTAATEAAYVSADLPTEDVELTWSEGDRVLVISPREPLAYASGSTALTVQARSYSIQLSGAARDATGRALEPFELTFSTAREIVVTLPLVADPASSGKYRSDGTDGVNECATAQQTVCAGVGATTGTPSYRGFASFDLASLPAERIGVSLAELSMTLSVVYGTPFATLGPLLLESVRFDAVGEAAFEASARGSARTIGTLAAPDDTARVDVLSAVRADAADATDPTRSQFRLRFTETATDDGGPDLIGLSWATLQLRVGYLVP
jgi:Big-like domain-containing protein